MTHRRCLRPGDKCPAVKLLQAVLLAGGYMPPESSPAADDDFGPNMAAGVRRLQEYAIKKQLVDGLEADEEAGPKTFAVVLMLLNVDVVASLPEDDAWPVESEPVD